MYYILQSVKYANKILLGLKAYYSMFKIKICISKKCRGEISQPSKINTGVRQGDGLSPILFNCVLELSLIHI